MAYTRDATSRWALPQSSAEWTSFLAGTGMSNPTQLWLFQEASGTFADSIGTATLSINGAISYRQAVTGWATLAMSPTAGGANYAFNNTNAGLWDGASGAGTLLLYAAVTATPAADRDVALVGDSNGLKSIVTSTNVPKLVINAAGTPVSAPGAIALGTTVHPWIISTDGGVTPTFNVLQDDLETVSPAATRGTSASKQIFFGGVVETAPAMLVLYAALFVGQSMSGSQRATLLGLLQPPPLAASPFEPMFHVGRHPGRFRSMPVDPVATNIPIVNVPTPNVLRPSIFHVGRHPGRFRGVPLDPVATNTPVVTTPTPATPEQFLMLPGRHPGRFRTVVQQRAMNTPTPVIPPAGTGPAGAAGAATFVMLLEPGARVTYTWQTDTIKAWSGLEQRIATIGAPRQKYAFSTAINDTQLRPVLSALVGNTAQAQPFLLGLSYEELSVVANANPVTTVQVGSTASCDWAIPGQRAVILSSDWSTSINCVVQSSTASTIIVDVDVSAVAKIGARIMPAMLVYLDPQQSFSRYPVNAGKWNLSARAIQYGYAGSLTMGVGATVTSYNGIPVWDRGIASNNSINQPLYSGAELVDLGGAVGNQPSFLVADWGRQLRIESDYVADWQWLKSFLSAIRGSQVAFLAPTQRPDLSPIGDASSGTLKVVGPPTANAPDYAGVWFQSLAHRYLQFTLTSGAVAYRQVQTATNNGDGTQSLGLDVALAGAISSVSFLEQCRLESDDVAVTWNGAIFTCELSARVVQQ